MLCQLGPRGASSDAGARRTTRDKYDASVGCSAAKGPGRLRDDRLFSSDDITILVHGKWGFATTETRSRGGVPITVRMCLCALLTVGKLEKCKDVHKNESELKCKKRFTRAVLPRRSRARRARSETKGMVRRRARRSGDRARARLLGPAPTATATTTAHTRGGAAGGGTNLRCGRARLKSQAVRETR